jgi:hypothetical protein
VLELKNKCLLSQWLFKLLTEEGMRQQFLSNKYLKNQTLAQVEEKPTNFPFWKCLMRVKTDFLTGVILKWETDLQPAFGRASD